MSQQLLQQGSRPGFIGRAAPQSLPSPVRRSRSGGGREQTRQPERLSRTSPQTGREQLSLKRAGLTLAFTVLAFSLVLVYAVAWARLAREDYRRQRLEAEIEGLRADAAQLRFNLHVARSPERIAEAARQSGMRLADPAKELDCALLAEGSPGRTIVAARERGRIGGPPLGAGLLPSLSSRHP